MLGNVRKILHAPGNIVVDPSWSGSLDPDSFPWGGTVLGDVEGVSLIPFHEGFTVWAEEYGEPIEQLEALEDWGVGCFFRGWDDDAIASLMPDPSQGDVTQHWGIEMPGTVLPGDRMTDRGRVLVFSPLNPRDVPGFVFRNALPVLETVRSFVFQHQEQLGVPIVFRCLRNDAGKIGEVKRLWDITL